MARLHCATGVEKLLIPPFVFFFNLLYPPPLVNRGRLAAAAGGCVLLRRGAADFAALRGAVIDDVSLAREVRRGGGRLRLENSRGDVRSLREHGGLAPIWHMVTRTAFTQLRRSWLLLALTLLGLLVAVLPPVSLLLIAAYLPTVRAYRLNPLWALTRPLATLLYGAMTLDSALRPRREW